MPHSLLKPLRHAFVCGLLLAASSCHTAAPDSSPDIEIFRDLEFARPGGTPLELDLYRPARATTPLPTVLVIREGGWQRGEKESLGPLASALAQRGLAAASIDYRGAAEAPFPAFIDDTRSALRWLRSNAATYKLDPERFGAIGGSWGGYLAVYTGLTSTPRITESEPSPDELSALVAISAPLDLNGFPDRMESFLGESYSHNPGLWQFASASSHVTAGSPPLLLIASQTDETVPYQQSLLMAQRYGEAGAEVELHLLPRVGHTPFWHYNIWLHDLAAAFFHRHLGSGKQ